MQRLITATFACVFAINGAASADLLVPVDQDRYVHARANSTDGAADSELVVAPDDSPFEASLSASAGGGHGTASQNSEILPNGIVFSGTTYGSGWSSVHYGGASGLGTSYAAVDFVLTTQSVVHITGSLEWQCGPYSASYVSVELTDGGGTIFSFVHNTGPDPENGSAPFDEELTLDPGQYTYEVHVDSIAGGGDGMDDQSDAAGDLTLSVEAVCPEDLDGLNGVGQGDLNAVLNRRGDADCLPGGNQHPCPEDLDGLDGVGQGDLNAVLNRWGDPECAPMILGACCYGLNCGVATSENCAAFGGSFMGDGNDCADVWCSTELGSCCYIDGTCADLNETHCLNSGGTWSGPDTDCVFDPCPQPEGVCCLWEGGCFVSTVGYCSGQGGTYMGDFTACDPNPCPQPSGACCYADGSCQVGTDAECAAWGGNWSGAYTSCTPNLCPQPGRAKGRGR